MIYTQMHREGMQKVKAEDFNDAIDLFVESYEHFSRYPWLDVYRYVLLGSDSAYAYREMDLLNIAFCYGQLGNSEKCREYYQQALIEYPDNKMATLALRMIDGFSPVTTE